MKRRRYVIALGSVGLGSLAGCVDGGPLDNGDGSSDDGSGGDGGSDDGSGGDGGSDDGSGGDGGSDDGGDGGGGSSPEFADNFIMEATVENPEMDQEITITMRRNGQDWHVTYEAQDQTTEAYTVDDEVYFIAGGQCIKNPPETENPAPPEFPEAGEHEQIVEDLEGPPDRTETLNGEEVNVYEVDESTSLDYAGFTVFVDADSGYLRRVEVENMVIEYHSFGEVDDIEAPDENCQEVGGGGEY